MEEQEILKIAIPLVAIPVAGILLFRHHFADHNHALRLLHFNNLDECMVELDNIAHASTLKVENDWTFYQNLVHCRQSVEFSMTGYPENKSKIFQNTIGTLVFNQFEHQGYMRHDRSALLPGTTQISPSGNTSEAVANLKQAIIDFENYKDELKPHFAYGKLSKSQFANAHCMHLADHFAMMTY